MTRKKRTNIKIDFVDKLIECSNIKCPVGTKIVVPSDYDTSNKTFVCAFYSASPPQQNKQFYAAALVKSLKEENCSRTQIAKELISEQKIIEEKSSNLILTGTKGDGPVSDGQLVSSICSELDVKIAEKDFTTRRIGSAHAETGLQILQIKFNSAEHRKALLQRAKKLWDSLNFKNVYIQPDLTKSERELQYKLREEKRRLQTENPQKSYRIKNGQVLEVPWLEPQSQFKVFLYNAQSILTSERRLNLSKLLAINNPTLICLTETWLDPSVENKSLFSNLPYCVICRSDRQKGQHGGVLIAASTAYITKTNVLFENSGSYFCSCLFQSESWYLGVILLYLPGRTSDYHVDYSIVILELQRILTEFEKIIPSANLSSEILILGDFNLREACWDTAYSTLSDEQSLIDFLCVENSLVQIIDSPTHKSGNILDLAFFSHEHKWCYTVLDRDISDHSPLVLTTDIKMILEIHETQFSFAQFNYSLFKELLVLNRTLTQSCHSQDPSFLTQWFQALGHAIQLSLPRKRKTRRQLPFFYSSQTVHQINKLRTAERRSASPTVLIKLSSDLETLIEMDKTVLLRNLSTYSTNDVFALLRKLNNNASYPSTMKYGSLSANNTLAKADLFNRFFCSVYIKSIEETVLPEAENPSIFLSDLQLSVEIIHKYLEKVPRSSKPAADGIPPILLNTMSGYLAPFVYLLFTYITSTLIWPDL